jgi:hypothetical protein
MNDTFHDTQRLRGQMNELIELLHADGDRATEPRARAMFQTSAEVLTGLVKAFGDYELRDSGNRLARLSACRDSEL